MFSISRIFIQKKKTIQPGNVKEEVVLIQKRNETKAQFKEQLRLQSKKIIPEVSKRNLLKVSTRQLALMNRNIGNHNLPTSHRDVFSIRENMQHFKPGIGDLNGFSGDLESNAKPVSKRKNDVLIISARDFGNVVSNRNLERFKIKHYDDSILERNFQEETDSGQTDDEKNVDDFYNIRVNEEENLNSPENKRKPRKHAFLEDLKNNRKNSSGLILDALNAKESLNSEFYRTPRNNIERIRDEDFLQFSPKNELNSIQEIVKNMPKIPSKKESKQSFSSKKMVIERSFKFDLNTDDENSQMEQSKTSESLRKLQNNIKKGFLEDINFGSSIFRKSSIVMEKNEDLVLETPKAENGVSPLKSEVASEAGELFKKKQVGSKDLENLELNLSDKQD